MIKTSLALLALAGSTIATACPMCDQMYDDTAYAQMARAAQMEEARTAFVARFKDPDVAKARVEAVDYKASSDTSPPASPGDSMGAIAYKPGADAR